MKLYSYWRSTAAYRVRIALNIKRLEYKYEAIHLVKNGGEHYHDNYKSINPQSLVPAFATDDGQIITQSLAIIDYLEDAFPQYALYPQEPIQKAKAKAMALSIGCDIHPLNNLRVLKYLKNHDWQQPQIDQWYAHWIQQGFKAIEQQLVASAGRYCFADEITVADIFLVAQVYNANRFKVSMDAYPLIRQINSNCLKLQVFIDAAPENQPDNIC
ncbi:Maleylacetoacetate isomerase @ Glutathione S-transferase, zeta [hydrothermal vent metagenome]|uniref:Maleylacetoacetate isomerase @ Glutathione S-transferase, zeta n=1 Tax=hydrothermal vent metagenome TaxID=652676 RepID=A0A3B0V7X1_9ZZZZ